MQTLRDVAPAEFLGGEYLRTPAYQLLDVAVLAKHDGWSWPGPQKNVCCWWELANGKAVGWNENPSRGWSFPVITYHAPAA